MLKRLIPLIVAVGLSGGLAAGCAPDAERGGGGGTGREEGLDMNMGGPDAGAMEETEREGEEDTRTGE